MNFLFVDKILSIQKNESISAVKVISFEEVYLTKPNHLEGYLAPTLLMECLMQSFASLIHYSSDFTLHPIFEEIAEIKILDKVGTGYVLEISCEVEKISEKHALFHGEITFLGKKILEAKKWAIRLEPLEKYYDPDDLRLDFIQLARVAKMS